MKVNSKEVDSLKKGLRKFRQKNRYRFSREEKQQLKKMSVILDSLEYLKAEKKSSLRKTFDRLVKYVLKLFVY